MIKKRRERCRPLPREAVEMIPMWVELGARPADIAAALGMKEGSLAVMCSRLKISLKPTRKALSDALSPQHWAALRHEATRRGLPVWGLVAQILVSVVDYGLLPAVLGDYDAASNAEGGNR